MYQNEAHKKPNYARLSMDEIVFENRNKAYGAFFLRQRYYRVLLLALITAVVIFVLGLSTPAILKALGLTKPDAKGDVAIEINNVLFNQVPLGEPQKPIVNTTPPPPSGEMKAKDDANTPPPDNKKNNSDNDNSNNTDTTRSGGKNDGNKGDSIYFQGSVEKEAKCPYSFEKYLRENLVYPEEAQNFEISGTVIVSFIIEADGKISHVGIVGSRRLGHGCEEAAMKVIQDMNNYPPWIPGEFNGRKVRLQYKTPITFGRF